MTRTRSTIQFWITWFVCWGLLACAVSAHAQPAPQLAATWQSGGQAVRVAWKDAPAGSCLYLRGQFVPVPCGAAGRAVLPIGGVDAAYAPRGGDELMLVTDETDPPHARATVPLWRVILPLITAP